MTQSGYKCQSWTSQCPHRHHRTPEIFPELSNTGNACRNPGGQAPLGPWCYTTNSTVRWEYCNISTCAPGKITSFASRRLFAEMVSHYIGLGLTHPKNVGTASPVALLLPNLAM